MMMNKQPLTHSQPRPRREDARDLQSRLYREIGLAAVAAELFSPETAGQETTEARRANVTVIKAADRAA
jgi:hypothetical protein